VERRRFEHLYVELCLALGELAPRYALWLHMGESGCEPDTLERDAVVRFCSDDLEPFLFQHGLALTPRKLRRLVRSVSRFDPSQATPEERLAGLLARIAGQT
jgi:hypothetical protein